MKLKSKLLFSYRLRLVIAAVIASLALVSALEAAHWKRYQSPKGQFSIEMPGSPKISHESTKTAAGRIPEEIAEVKNSTLDLTAEYSDLPGIAVFFGGTKTILRKASDGVVKHAHGTEISHRKLKKDGYDGREVQYKAPDKKSKRTILGTVHLYMVKKRLYVLEAKTYQDKPDKKGIQRFLDSFRLEVPEKEKKKTDEHLYEPRPK